MKNSFLILIIGILFYSCGTIPKLKNGNSFEINRIGIMDTLTVIVSGKIFDLYDKFEIKGAKVELTNNENSYSETCGKKGEFKFEHIASGKYKIWSSYIGYYTLTDSIEFKSGEIIEMNIGLGYDE